jgi:hypothetical protein
MPRIDGLFFAVGNRLQTPVADSEGEEIVAHCLGAAFAEGDVVLVGTAFVTIAREAWRVGRAYVRWRPASR